MKKGEILRVIVDYEPAIRNVPRSMEEQGHKVLSINKINDTDYEIRTGLRILLTQKR